MKIYKISIIFLFLLMFSIGAVCAADADNSTVDLTDDSEISVGEKTYTDLDNLIASSTSSKIEINDDYKYNNETDNQTVISLQDSSREYVFEGNNHVIDANAQAGLFYFKDMTVTINNLVIKNCNGHSITFLNGTLTTNNVTFLNNTARDYSAAVYCRDSNYTSTGDTFKDNYAPTGSSIVLVKSKFNAKDDVFVSKNPAKWAMIYGANSEINIENSIFANTTSKYATAIYNTYKTTVKKSKFINLMANLTAGAIALKSSSNNTLMIIEDCDFINVTSSKNGGAIYADIPAAYEYEGYVLISNSRFTDCASMFGGAVLQLGGDLEIVSCDFEDNYAHISGAAVYTSFTSTNITNSNFTNNYAYWQGGALYIDAGRLKSNNNGFAYNNASEGGGIYLYESYYEIINSDFTNNGEAILAYFDNYGSYQKNNNFARDKVVLNQVYYGTDVYFEGKEIVLNPLKIEGSANDTYFNLAKLGLVTPVKDQGDKGACWAFGTAGALESSFLIATNITLDISENNIQGSAIRYSIYGDRYLAEAGTYTMGSDYFLSWLGVVSTVNDEYDELGKVTPVIFEENAYHILDAVYVNISNAGGLKQALTKYGALNFYLLGAVSGSDYYNENTSAFYYNGNITANHYVTLVGWDDNFSASNFLITPPGDGAWICKNSWGTEWGDEGYFYISYYDNSLKTGVDAVGFFINNTQIYDKVYQYDVLGFTDDFNSSVKEYMNRYIAGEDDLIGAVGTYFEYDNSDYNITVYVNGSEVYSQQGKSLFRGFNTVKLNQKIFIHKGDEFSVKVTSASMPIIDVSRLVFQNNVSFADFGRGMVDLTKSNIITSIKVYTIANTADLENIRQSFSPTRTFVAYSDLEGSNITLKQNGNVIASAVVKNGMADFGVVLAPGDYTLTHQYNDTLIITQVKITNSIIVDKNITVGSNSKHEFDVVFVDDCGNPLVGTYIPWSYDGEKRDMLKTDDEGKFSMTIYKDISLGNHTLIFANPVTEEEFTVNINVVSRLQGVENIKMYYFDGTQITFQVLDSDANPADEGESVIVLIGNDFLELSTDENGTISYTIPKTALPGKYYVNVCYAGQTVTKTLDVKQVLKSKKTVTVKKSAKKLVLKATLKGKTPLKKQVVKFKLNGKTYKGKTNAKGIVKVKVKKSAIKKLKAGKKYAVKITYLKNTIKTTLKVKG